MPVKVPKQQTAEKKKTKILPPKKVNVVLVDGESASCLCAGRALKQVFNMNSNEARMHILRAHKSGISIIASYPLDVAETKVKEADSFICKRLSSSVSFKVEPS